MRLCGIQQIKQAPPKYRLSGRPNTWILSTAMKAKAKKVRKRNDEMARIHRENIASRKRVMRADALGKKSKEFCLADHVGDAIRRPLDLSPVGVQPQFEVKRMKAKPKAKAVRTQSKEISRIHQENIASRKRAKRARALGQESKEFCLAHYMRDATLDFSRVEAKDIED